MSARLRGALLLLLGLAATVSPALAGRSLLWVTGLALVGVGLVSLVAAFRATGQGVGAVAYASGGASILLGLLVLWQPSFAVGGLLVVLALVLAGDGVATIVAAGRDKGPPAMRGLTAFGGLVDLGLAAILWTQRRTLGPAALGVLIGIRILASGWSLLLKREPEGAHPDVPADDDAHPDRALGLVHPEIGRLRRELAATEEASRPTDLYWGVTLVAVFLAIHIGRLGAELTVLGLISPVIAAVGDVMLALLLAALVGLPTRLAWRRVSRPLERAAWRAVLGETAALPRASSAVGVRLVVRWLRARLAFSAGLVAARASLGEAAWRAVRAGLPVAAVLVAVNPIWGFSWYFNSENWASAFWQAVAAQRTDRWREAMAVAVAGPGIPPATVTDVTPAGLEDEPDFSFLVIGDPGEGDASQHALRNTYLGLARRQDLRFVVVSSDVIYPAGAMRDYEPNFYLPLMGVSQPIFAIPGNHDWFDALDAFAANLFTPEAARQAILARVDVDERLTSTTPARVEALLAEAARLRRAYHVASGLQRLPYFEIHTARFSLITVDTGILRRVDDTQRAWLEAALARAAGHLVMVVVGHPFYAGGLDQSLDDPGFADLLRLLRARDVEIVMAGDTHDLEYYRQPGATRSGRTQHHVVNGGGGAYLSIGTALGWPASPPVRDWAYYPRTDRLVAKLDAETPAWKRPLWWWIRRFGAWPLTAETLSAAFDFNRVPFFQSLVEVRVERSRNRVRLLAHGVDGPLTWGELEVGGAVRPPGRGDLDPVEIEVALPR